MYVDVLCVCEEKTISRYLRFVTHQVICQPGTTLKSTRETGAHFLVLNSTFGFYLQADMSFKTVVYFVLTATYLIFQV